MILNIDDLRKAAKHKLPRVIYEFISGGADDEVCVERNLEVFRACRLLPRYLVDVSVRNQAVDLLGETYSHPFGIGPVGMADLARKGTDLFFAGAARKFNVPFVLSGASNASIEAAAKTNPAAWLQLYVSRSDEITVDMIKRAADAGYRNLVITVDVPVNSKRERNIRSGWVRPYKPTLPVMLEALKHPGWVMSYLRHGVPTMESWTEYAPPGSDARGVAEFYAGMVPCPQTWASVEQFRERWNGSLIVKGILNPDDAKRAKSVGVDALVVSNHGGRQLDRSVSPIEMLPAIREAVGADMTLIADSGIRRGADVITALALGADFVFVGRAAAYGAAAAGQAGVERALEVLRGEVDLIMGQIGCTSVADLDRSFVLTA